jgi:hypothetical protein
MTLTLELTPEEERRVATATAKGIDVSALLKGVLASLPAEPEAPAVQDKTLELFAQWEAEDATDDPEELARRQAEWEEFKANMNANRALEGRPPVYP